MSMRTEAEWEEEEGDSAIQSWLKRLDVDGACKWEKDFRCWNSSVGEVECVKRSKSMTSTTAFPKDSL